MLTCFLLEKTAEGNVLYNKQLHSPNRVDENEPKVVRDRIFL